MLYRKFAVFLAFIVGLACSFPEAAFAAEPESREIVNRWCFDIIDAPEDIPSGEHSVRIAVIDSGVAADIPYMQQDRIAPGYNYVFRNTVTDDLIGHGTRTAGIIEGGGSGSRELMGIDSHAVIVPLVWITKSPDGILASGGISALCTAIRDAVDVYGCRIINISSGISRDEPELREAAAYAEEKGAILVSAAGNDNSSAPDELFYPAAYETVVGVGSVNEDKRVSEFSQRNTGVMVTAPGEMVYSLSSNPSKDFVQVSGTSYSAAYVSGFAALLLSKYPEMSPEEFRQILKASSQDLGEPGYDTAYGYGLIDLSRGLSLCEEIFRGCFPDCNRWRRRGAPGPIHSESLKKAGPPKGMV